MSLLSRVKQILIVTLVLLAACSKSQDNQQAAQETEDYTPVNNVIEANQNWKGLINTDIQNLGQIYTSNGFKINPDGNVVSGSASIVEELEGSKSDWINIDTIYTNKNVTADSRQNYEYEIGTFITESGSEFNHLVIWNTKTAPKKRELEFIAQADVGDRADSNVLTEVDNSRSKWIQLCNDHNANVLVEEMYTDNAVYYNHKPVVIGTEAISREYQYMNNKDYSLHLEPIITKLVSSSLALEIGQCSGSYNGKYVIVWEKGDSGEWKVLLDSNI